MCYQLIAHSVTHMQTHEMHFNVMGIYEVALMKYLVSHVQFEHIATPFRSLSLSHTHRHNYLQTHPYGTVQHKARLKKEG